MAPSRTPPGRWGNDRRPGRYDDRGPARYDDRGPARYDDRSAERKPWDAPPPRTLPPRAPRFDEGAPREESTWFVLNVGRLQNADPKWIVPMLCRRGGITKDDIGAIRVFEHVTRVEIVGGAVSRFEEQSSKPDRKDPRLVIELDRGRPPPRAMPPRAADARHGGPGRRGK
jgi:ATP-dependent RNA helicase DeaD